MPYFRIRDKSVRTVNATRSPAFSDGRVATAWKLKSRKSRSRTNPSRIYRSCDCFSFVILSPLQRRPGDPSGNGAECRGVLIHELLLSVRPVRLRAPFIHEPNVST